MTAQPITVRVTRYKCPCCGRTAANRARTAKHIGNCWLNPEAKGCKTCKNFQAGHDGCGCEPGCNWGGAPVSDSCAVGVSLAGQPAFVICPAHKSTDGNPFGTEWADTCTDCRTDGKAIKPGPIVHCEKWESADADR